MCYKAVYKWIGISVWKHSFRFIFVPFTSRTCSFRAHGVPVLGKDGMCHGENRRGSSQEEQCADKPEWSHCQLNNVSLEGGSV